MCVILPLQLFVLLIRGHFYMQLNEYRFEDLPNILAKNNELLLKVSNLLEVAILPQKESSDFLTITEASELLNLSVATIYTKVSKGELSSMKRGKRLYFSKKELTEFITAGRRSTVKEVGELAVPTPTNAKEGGEK